MNRKNKLKWGLTTLVFLIIWALCVWIFACGNNKWKEWAGFAFFTIMLILPFMMFAKTVIGSPSVVFTDENLVILGFFGKKTPIPWHRIEGFGTWQTRYQNQIKVFTHDTEKEISTMPTAFRRFLARVNYKYSGAIYFILEDLSGIGMEELLEKCNHELKNHQSFSQLSQRGSNINF